MRIKLFFNIKLNSNFELFKFLPNYISSEPPEISSNSCKDISLIKQGSIWKTTVKSRNKRLIYWINKYLKKIKFKSTILELGASTGVSVFSSLRKKNKIKKYYLTDLQFNYYYKNTFSNTLVFSKKKDLIPFMVFNRFFIFYSDSKSYNLVLNFFSYLFRTFISLISRKKRKKTFQTIDNKILHLKKKYPIIFCEYNILSPWKFLKTDLVIALNLLNSSYFSKDKMKLIIINIYHSLKLNGYVIVGDNFKKDKISIFQKKNGKFILIDNRGGKVNSHDYFLNFLEN